ncbi:N-acetylmuramoyl-L-alanine amidase LytC precursor [Anaerotignum neopropionicum]|uniref:N-acetylmuramoyl-L-alanine amidase LytC n=1 Tax=Anaerotignum neopropionicum TaxID=36847 RepID=A0A136WDT7_9FIRM|nr:N-acetylmuramoyl-L-alanine amidase [Anaerotignum neopropionicum]KXL52687.1 N-acetylmuramoyl-L-alanine amidase LytC precursor [Anaerotignum neopropionicum]
MAIKIYIDQGHSRGVNAGAEGFGLYEQDVVWQVGMYLADLLNNTPGYEARVSRPTIDTVLGYNNSTSLAARVADANAWGADYFISIHTNASTNPSYNGSEVYIYSDLSPSLPLAETILQQLVAEMGTKNNGIFLSPRFYVLRRTQMPSLLVELAYITNAQDAEKLRNNQFEFAQAIYDGIRIQLG